MKTAILISGFPNFFEQSHGYIFRNIISQLGDCDFFIDTWFTTKEDKDKLIKLYNPKTENFEIFDEKAKMHLENKDILIKAGVPENTIFMWKKISSGIESIINYSLSNNIKYDLFLKIRLDFFPSTLLNPDWVDKTLSKQFVFNGPHVVHSYPQHAGDCYFSCHFDFLPFYKNFYSNLSKFTTEKKFLKPEYFFYNQIKNLNLNIQSFEGSWARFVVIDNKFLNLKSQPSVFSWDHFGDENIFKISDLNTNLNFKILSKSIAYEGQMRTKFFSKDNKIIDLASWDTSGSVEDLYRRYGWEGAMAYGNLIHDELNAFGPGVQKGDIFLDLGANIGMSSIRAESRGASKIYCIEPDPDVFSALEKNKDSNWILENVAIDSEEGHIEVSKWPNYWEFRSIKAITLEQFFIKHKIEKIDYMKVDIEGHEKTVFEKTPQDIWNKINKLFIEIHGFSKEEKDKFITDFIKRGFDKYHISIGHGQDFLWMWK